jgi:Protein of unknown function (DUF1566)/Kelch motif
MTTLFHITKALHGAAIVLSAVALFACGGGGGYGSSAPSVTSITPLVATANAPTVFTVVGANLPLTAVLVLQDGSCTAATNNTATGFKQSCTFTLAGQKTLIVPVGSGYSFTVAVAASQYVKVCNDGSREGMFSCPMNPVLGSASNEWACTLDTLTNKMWEVKTNDGGLRDYANQYTTYDDITKNQKTVGGAVVPPTQQEVDASTNVMGYVKAVNALGSKAALCGSTSWRVPSLTELATLAKGTAAPTIDTAYFPNTNSQSTITSTPQIMLSGVISPNSVSIVDFNTGDTSCCYIMRSFLKPVRLVSNDTGNGVCIATTSTGSMFTGHTNHTATLLADGNVLVSGTGSSTNIFAELYHPSSASWSLTGSVSVNESRTIHTSTLLPNNKVLMIGGSDMVSNGVLGTAEIYAPLAFTWTQTTSMAASRYGHTATLLASGKVLVIGGCTGGPASTNANCGLATAEIYDPSLGTWSAAASLPSARLAHTATVLNNGEILVAGGVTNNLGNSVLSSSLIYNPTTGLWRATNNNLTTARYHQQATLLTNGMVLVSGGLSATGVANALASAELFDPATGLWSPTASMSAARYGHTQTLLPSNQTLVTGGRNISGYLSSNELYNLNTGTWGSTCPLLSPRGQHTATLLNTGKVLITGGSNASSALSNSELY